MKIKISKILKLKIIEIGSFKDKRGVFIESFDAKKYYNNLGINFIEDDFCINKKNVFRGIHGDKKTWKLISCIHGKIDSYVIDCNEKSKTFGLHERFSLSPQNYYQILIPPMYGNAYYIKEANSIYHYKQNRKYSGSTNQFTYKWYDTKIKLNLRNKKLIISERDR